MQMRVELFDRIALAVYNLPKIVAINLLACCSSVKELLKTIKIKSNLRLQYKICKVPWYIFNMFAFTDHYKWT